MHNIIHDGSNNNNTAEYNNNIILYHDTDEAMACDSCDICLKVYSILLLWLIS